VQLAGSVSGWSALGVGMGGKGRKGKEPVDHDGEHDSLEIRIRVESGILAFFWLGEDQVEVLASGLE